MKKIKQYFLVFCSFLIGFYFSRLCYKYVGAMGWDIFNSNAQNVTTRHPWGEDLSQFILSLMGAVAGFSSALGYIFFPDNMLFFEDDE